MILLWLDINCSYAHSSLALPALHAQSATAAKEWQWRVVSGTIGTPISHFVREAIKCQPNVIAATAWLFNHNLLLEVVSRIKALMPQTYIILGGPEFLGNNEDYLKQHTNINAVCRGEGEEIFPQWLQKWGYREQQGKLQGICTIDAKGIYQDGGTAKAYHFGKLQPPESSPFFHFDKPFVQIETTRGCNNDCYFCISGGDKPIRSLSMEQMESRLHNFAERGVKEVRVVDRTFNANPKRTISLLSLFSQFTGVMRFHLEIHPALLTNEIITILQNLPNGLLHIEAGVQSLDDCVLEASGRIGDSIHSMEGIGRLRACNRFEVHADLIAGLPNYSLSRIKEDVKKLMSSQLDEIQLELLKLLPGTKMREKAASLGIAYAPTPPYEVLATPAISPQALYEVQQLSRLLDGWYNGKSDWHEVFIQLTLTEFYFLDTFLHNLIQKEILEQPLSMERRGLLLYDFCKQHYPAYLPEVAAAWISAGFSLNKLPGQQATLCKKQYNSFPNIRFYHLTAPSGDYWFGFDRKEERRRPCITLRRPPE